MKTITLSEEDIEVIKMALQDSIDATRYSEICLTKQPDAIPQVEQVRNIHLAAIKVKEDVLKKVIS